MSASERTGPPTNSPQSISTPGQSSLHAYIRPQPQSGDAPNHPTITSEAQQALESLERHALEVVGRRQRRKRIRFSCTECHRRKHKCDRQTPCSSCVERGVADRCRPAGDDGVDAYQKLRRLEDLIVQLVGAKAGSLPEPGHKRRRKMPEASAQDRDRPHDWSDSTPGSSTQANSSTDSQLCTSCKKTLALENTRKPRTSSPKPQIKHEPDSNNWFGTEAIPSAARGIIRTQFESQSLNINGEKIDIGTKLDDPPPMVSYSHLVSEGGAPIGALDDLFDSLPSYHETIQLIDIYFNDINVATYAIDEHRFRHQLAQMADYVWKPGYPRNWEQGSRMVGFLAQLISVLVITYRCQPETLGSEEDGMRKANVMFHLCRRALDLASYIQLDNEELVLSYLVFSRFLVLRRQASKAWMNLGRSAQMAQLNGLHRDGSKFGIDPAETEYRRRIWSLIYYNDKIGCIMLGQPQLLQDSVIDALPPSEFSSEELSRLPRGEANFRDPFDNKNTPAGTHTYLALRHLFAEITAKIGDHFQNIHTSPEYKTVLELDKEIDEFRQRIPYAYRLDAAASNDVELGRTRYTEDRSLAIHRYILNMDVAATLIGLHRPYMLRNSDEYLTSRIAAIEAALYVRHARFRFQQEVKWPPHRARSTFIAGLFRYFSATLIFGVALLTDPLGPRAKEYSSYLEEFIQSLVKVKDDPEQCNIKEVKIINRFLTRARRIAERSQRHDPPIAERIAPPEQFRQPVGPGGRILLVPTPETMPQPQYPVMPGHNLPRSNHQHPSLVSAGGAHPSEIDSLPHHEQESFHNGTSVFNMPPDRAAMCRQGFSVQDEAQSSLDQLISSAGGSDFSSLWRDSVSQINQPAGEAPPLPGTNHTNNLEWWDQLIATIGPLP